MTNWGRLVITNWDTVYYKLGQVLQIVARFITNWGRYYTLAQFIANQGTKAFVFVYILSLEKNNSHQIQGILGTVKHAILPEKIR